jgi:ubiquinone/menaquinone biosynthesis C-methylase UbiE
MMRRPQTPSRVCLKGFVMATSAPSPELFFDTMNAYQRTAALKTAIELGLFTAITEPSTASELAARCGASPRGTRILCDYLTIVGFLTKTGDRYAATADTAIFLNRNSPAYLGGTMEFLASPGVVRNFDQLTDTVRKGTVDESRNTVSTENPVWVPFARAMMPMMVPAAEGIASALGVDTMPEVKVLDIAAGHGAFGLAIARRNPRAEIVAVDWAPVLAVALENARAAGADARYGTVAGDAFTVDYGHGYHIALLTNFLHHFDEATCTGLLGTVRRALAPEGRVAILEFVPNPDRISPPTAAAFSMMMLGGTPYGDAYTFDQLRHMLESAGFVDVAQTPLPMSPETLVTGRARA